MGAIPVAMIAVIANFNKLAETIPALKPVVNFSPVLTGLLQAMVPTILLVVFMALLPKILLQFGKRQGLTSESELAKSVMRRYFLFLMVNVLLVTTIAGSIIPIANKLADGPLTVIDLLGQSIPGVAIFFILYVMLQALSGFPLMLLRPAPLILGYLKGKRAKTAFQDRAAWAPGEIFYGAEISKSLIIFHIGLIFSTIAPVILPICTVYYAFGYVAYKYNILYVHVNTFEAGGSFWPDMATRITWGLILFQLTILVVIFSRYVKRAFYLPTEVLPLGIASDIDNGRDAVSESTGILVAPLPDGGPHAGEY